MVLLYCINVEFEKKVKISTNITKKNNSFHYRAIGGAPLLVHEVSMRFCGVILSLGIKRNNEDVQIGSSL